MEMLRISSIFYIRKIERTEQAKSLPGCPGRLQAVEKVNCQNVKFGAGVKMTKERAKIRSLGSSPF